MKMRHLLAVALLSGGAITAGLLLQPQEPQAADHTDSTATKADASLDIGDFYAWHKGTGADQKLVTVLTFSGLKAPATGQKADYNENALYTVHIDNDGDIDNGAEIKIYVRFGKNPSDEWGVQVLNLPGSGGPVTGAVETAVPADNGGQVWAGLRDDPFFFDFEGFNQTATTGTLAFDKTRDSFKGTNTSAIVLEMPMSSALGAGTALKVWATTAKK